MTEPPASTAVWCEHALLGDEVHDGVTVLVSDGRFASVEPGTRPSGDAARLVGLTLPGAANAHSHAFHRALRHRSQTGRGTFWTWREQMYAIAARLDPDSYRRLARAAFAEMVMAGYTTVGEFHYVHHQPDGSPYSDLNAMGLAVLDAARDAGIRITVLDTAYLHGGIAADGSSRSLGKHQLRFGDTDVDAWIGRVSALGDIVDGDDEGDRLLGAAIHSVRAVRPDEIARIAAWTDRRALPLHAHVSEQPAENEQCAAAYGATPVAVLADGGALTPRFTAVHATHLTDADIARLGAAGSSICMCATTERDLADGIGPARRLADAGATICVGSDSHAVIDPYAEVRAIELDERLAGGERGVFTTVELAAALTDGHRSLGWDDVGGIAVGQRADLVTLGPESVRMAGSGSNCLDAAVFAATAADVTEVMIGGRVVVADGRHATVDVVRELNESIATVAS